MEQLKTYTLTAGSFAWLQLLPFHPLEQQLAAAMAAVALLCQRKLCQQPGIAQFILLQQTWEQALPATRTCSQPWGGLPMAHHVFSLHLAQLGRGHGHRHFLSP